MELRAESFSHSMKRRGLKIMYSLLLDRFYVSRIIFCFYHRTILPDFAACRLFVRLFIHMSRELLPICIWILPFHYFLKFCRLKPTYSPACSFVRTKNYPLSLIAYWFYFAYVAHNTFREDFSVCTLNRFKSTVKSVWSFNSCPSIGNFLFPKSYNGNTR